MSDGTPRFIIRQVNHPDRLIVAECPFRDDAVLIAELLADRAKSERWIWSMFEVEAPDGQKRRFGGE